MGRPDLPISERLKQMGLQSIDEGGGDILAPSPDQWQLGLWEQSQAQIRGEKEKLIADMTAGRVSKDEFGPALQALNQQAAEIYQRLLVEEKQNQSNESAE